MQLRIVDSYYCFGSINYQLKGPQITTKNNFKLIVFIISSSPRTFSPTRSFSLLPKTEDDLLLEQGPTFTFIFRFKFN